ncbi:inositol monophosphatase family protein [Defluviimonas sp. WL0002]|uniref:Inositol monophosphatase family protein n=1 Tax=Albidovulum marisflavi TaxID=2984159 RepID=A0ABT2ZAP2_9RHOB|nr:inositol monophosphatase family protein [Defluviimonas sp. WL0002]MCV2868102.1 inositol monophosphatase family protein [Defluviimonas sp. WL0002]
MKSLSLSDDVRLSLIAVAHRLADVARAETLTHFRSPVLSIESKGASGFDPVTQADRAAELAMRAVLAEMRQDDAIFGEEFGRTAGTSGLTWVLDPIDGTRAYMSGTPTWGVLIAVSDASGPILGVIDQPYIGERFIGGLGLAEVAGPMGRSALQCRSARPLAESVLFTTFPEVGTALEGEAFRRVAARSRLTRYGMDCYAYALLAAGQIDLVIEAGLSAYDIQAPIAVIEAAGGIVTNWQGGSAHAGGQVIAAANADVHAEALCLLGG